MVIFFFFLSGELSQFFVSKSPHDSVSKTAKFSVGISGSSTVFLDANETEYGYEVKRSFAKGIHMGIRCFSFTINQFGVENILFQLKVVENISKEVHLRVEFMVCTSLCQRMIPKYFL